MSAMGDVQHAHIWAAGMRFLLSKSIADKALQPDMAFLVAIINPSMPCSALFLCFQYMRGGCKIL
jgi:hypothetical protein